MYNLGTISCDLGYQFCRTLILKGGGQIISNFEMRIANLEARRQKRDGNIGMLERWNVGGERPREYGIR